MRLRLTGATAGLAVGVTLAVTSASALGAYLYSRHHYESLLASARATALMQGELIRAGLEHQMLENDRSLVERMIQSFAQQRQVERVMLLDRRGQLLARENRIEGSAIGRRFPRDHDPRVVIRTAGVRRRLAPTRQLAGQRGLEARRRHEDAPPRILQVRRRGHRGGAVLAR